jgi:acyl-CoA synthetase (AMP-forming)/AMP-acid ligase II
MNLASAIEFHARSRPDHPAVLGESITLSYREFAARVAAAEERFRTRGISQEALIGVCLKDTWEHVVVIYALARMGAVMLPLDWRWRREEKERVISHFGAAGVIVERDAEELGGCTNLKIEHPTESRQQSRNPPVESSELPLLLSLSSGTTGRPKGPRITHRHMLRRFWTHWINLGLNSSDRYLSATPLYFGGGRTFAMSVLFSGGTLILYRPPFDADSLCNEVVRSEATSTFLVPTQLRRLLELPPEKSRSLQRLKLLICSGAPLHPHERKAVR